RHPEMDDECDAKLRFIRNLLPPTKFDEFLSVEGQKLFVPRNLPKIFVFVGIWLYKVCDLEVRIRLTDQGLDHCGIFHQIKTLRFTSLPVVIREGPEVAAPPQASKKRYRFLIEVGWVDACDFFANVSQASLAVGTQRVKADDFNAWAAVFQIHAGCLARPRPHVLDQLPRVGRQLLEVAHADRE